MYTIKSVKDNLTVIVKLKKSNEALDLQLHDLAMNALYYCNKVEIGDVTLANNLLTALGRSHRKETLIAWFKHFGKFTTIKVEGKTMLKFSKKGKESPNNADFIDANFEQVMTEADESPFYVKTEKPEQDFVEYDLKQAIEHILKRVESLSKNDKNKFQNLELVADLRDLVAAV